MATEYAKSKDGTQIAFERTGQGPALVLVDGALCSRAFGPASDLAKALAPRFTVFSYDRRGRGESGDTAPFAVEREVEDLEAVARAAGGSPCLFGVSSGAALVLEAANRGIPTRKVAVYEAPFIVDDSRAPLGEPFLAETKEHVAAGRRGAAVATFMRGVGVPAVVRAIMRLMPAWKKLKQVAHTLPYDLTLVTPDQRGQPLVNGKYQRVQVPALIMVGGKSPAWLKNAAHAIAQAVSGATEQTLPGQTHMVNAKALAPALTAFFVDADREAPGEARASA